MDFIILKSSPVPAPAQITEQIKMALLLGRLRPGEMLPSIRDLEKELGISRNLVRKAYVELENLGILQLIHGKGVMVNRNLQYREDKDYLRNCEELLETVSRRCESAGLIVSSFARFMEHRAVEAERARPPLIYVDNAPELARSRARTLGDKLRISIDSWSIEELKVHKGRIQKDIKILCNYYRFDEVTKVLRGNRILIVPLTMTCAAVFTKELSRLPRESKVLFISDNQSSWNLLRSDLMKAIAGNALTLTFLSLGTGHNKIQKVINSGRYAKYVISNRIWDNFPADIKRAPTVTPLLMEFEPSSIEEAKTRLGITG